MSEISKAYEPQSVEDKWYDFWLKQGCFTADPARVSPQRPAYSIVIPPPNVTGMLTMGHVLNNTIQDILARKARMDGKEVLWLPGTDHAGIATQTVVEKTLKKAGEIRHRDDLGREKFLERVWQWKEKHGGIIIQQLKKLGASCDWTRERFTMDPEYSRCVQKVFVELYKKGLIYRGKRMVNWCPVSLTALSDEEVIMKEQKGSLYYFKVEVVDATPSSHKTSAAPGDEGVAATTCGGGAAATFLTIATTRPETIPGDTAVAVNPKDPRYAKLIGKHVIRPLPSEFPREQKLIPIIGDEHVDFEFGTGVLKVTPAHDKADFEIYGRIVAKGLIEGPSSLAFMEPIEVISANGTMNERAGADLKGLDRFKARKVAVEKLTELGALEKEEPYTNNVGYSERADVPIEPRLSEQWFLKYPSVEKSRACVEQAGSADLRIGALGDAEETGRIGVRRSDKMRFHPQRWAKVYDHWMGNIQDWCVSRQLWWGHRIPVWSKTAYLTPDNWEAELLGWGWDSFVSGNWNKDRVDVSYAVAFQGSNMVEHDPKMDPLMPITAATTDNYTFHVATTSEVLAKELEKNGFTQDPDVLDTWFSSWLWPFATMGWPEQTDTLKKFYPTTDLVTGPDIIFFWVARMIMAGYEFMGDLPFRNVYFTGIIRDKQGRKMSKSLGNSPDPLDLIGKYGADALRFGTMRSAPLGQDILFDEQNVELGRNFCNKLWNACRFRQMVGQSAVGVPPADQTSKGSQNFRQDAGSTFEVQDEIKPALLTSDDKWILLKLDQAVREITNAFAEYKFSDATATLYRFFWSEYCDWYVEASKAVLSGSSRGNEAPSEKSETPINREHATKVGVDQSLLTSAATNDAARKANTLAVIDFVLSHTLRLFHPFLPFITEELWHGMGYAEDMPEDQGGTTVMFAPWPKPLDDDFKSHYGLTERDEKHIEARNEFVTQGRNLRRTANIAANKKIRFILKPARELAAHDVEVLRLLLNAEAVEVSANYQPGKNTLTVRTELGDLFLPLEGLIDKEAETARLKKELEKIEAEAAKVEQKLANPNFTQKVPPAVLLEHQQRLAEWQGKRDHVKSTLEALKG
jgi:valyl-tRNA synthetase